VKNGSQHFLCPHSLGQRANAATDQESAMIESIELTNFKALRRTTLSLATFYAASWTKWFRENVRPPRFERHRR
jgi:hypothetical protein